MFKLTSSNFRIWDGDTAPRDADGLARQLELHTEHIVPGRSQQDILYELLLKLGLPLTEQIETRDAAGATVHAVAGGLLLVCLETTVTHQQLRAMIAMQPTRVVCLDHAFHGNDPLKTNIRLEMRSHGVEFRTV